MAPKKRKASDIEPVHIQPEVPVRYFNRDGVSDYLHCTICQEIFVEPMRISCGHTFCKNCINEWFNQRNGASCPTCRQDIIRAATHRDLLAIGFMEREDVFCSFGGCSWIGPFGMLSNHMSNCDCDPAKIPDYVSESGGHPRSGFRDRLFRKDGANRSTLRDVSLVDISGDSEIDLSD